MSAPWHGGATRAALVVVVLAVAACKGGSLRTPSVDTSLVIEDQGDRRQVVFAVTPVKVLREATLEFTLPQDCTVLAGAQRPQIKEIPAAAPFERSLVFRCPEGPAGRKVTVALTAKSEDGKAVQATDEATF